MRDCTKWWAPDRHILTYFLTRDRDEVYVIGTVPASGWEGEANLRPSSRETECSLCRLSSGLAVVLDAAMDVTEWPIYDREPRDDRWSAGRAVLLGDACHPVRPYMAAGGAMAIEDGIVLEPLLVADDDLPDALRAYEATRKTASGGAADLIR